MRLAHARGRKQNLGSLLLETAGLDLSELPFLNCQHQKEMQCQWLKEKFIELFKLEGTLEKVNLSNYSCEFKLWWGIPRLGWACISHVYHVDKAHLCFDTVVTFCMMWEVVIQPCCGCKYVINLHIITNWKRGCETLRKRMKGNGTLEYFELRSPPCPCLRSSRKKAETVGKKHFVSWIRLAS